MKCRIVQCLCGPRRHAIFAMAVNTPQAELSDDDARLGLEAIVTELIASRGDAAPLPLPANSINPTCGICDAPSTDWVYEVRWSREFADWDAAQAALRETERDNFLTRLQIDAAKARERN